MVKSKSSTFALCSFLLVISVLVLTSCSDNGNNDNNNVVQLFVADSNADAIFVFNEDDDGDIAAPQATITSTSFDTPRNVFVADAGRANEIFVTDDGGGALAVLVFDENDNGNVDPKRTIQGNGFIAPRGLFVQGGEVFVSDLTADVIFVFDQTDDGAVDPKRTITNNDGTGFQNTADIFILNDEIFAIDSGRDRVFVFDITDDGATVPKRSFSSNPSFVNPTGIFVDGTEIFVVDRNLDTVFVFDINTDGDNQVPLRTFTSAGNFVLPRKPFIIGNQIFVLDDGADTVFAFDDKTLSGDLTPDRAITSAANIVAPFGLAASNVLDTARKSSRKAKGKKSRKGVLNVSVEAVPRGVMIQWKDAAKRDITGFNVWRREMNDQHYKKISDLMIVSRKGLDGNGYSYLDVNAFPEQNTYYYKVEYITAEEKSFFDPPIALRKTQQSQSSFK